MTDADQGEVQLHARIADSSDVAVWIERSSAQSMLLAHSQDTSQPDLPAHGVGNYPMHPAAEMFHPASIDPSNRPGVAYPAEGDAFMFMEGGFADAMPYPPGMMLNLPPPDIANLSRLIFGQGGVPVGNHANLHNASPNPQFRRSDPPRHPSHLPSQPPSHPRPQHQSTAPHHRRHQHQQQQQQRQYLTPQQQQQQARKSFPHPPPAAAMTNRQNGAGSALHATTASKNQDQLTSGLVAMAGKTGGSTSNGHTGKRSRRLNKKQAAKALASAQP